MPADLPNGEEYELDAIADQGNLGAEPSSEYLESLGLLDNVTRECIFVSKAHAGIASPSGRHFYASVLFTALLTRAVSLLTLTPLSPWADKKIEHWDYASLAGMVRTMIELRVAFHYLCTEQCSPDEWDCRWNLFNLHDCISRKRLFDARGQAEQAAEFERQADELRDRLKSNAHFQSLDAKRHKKLLHGQTAYLFPLEEMAEKAGIAVDDFRWLYVLFSSHVHGLPMSYYRIGSGPEERGRGLPSPVEESYSSLCLSLAATLLAGTRDEFQILFKDLVSFEPSSTISEEEIASVAKGEIAAGQTTAIDVTDEIRILITRNNDDSADLVYHYRATGEVVLERSDSENKGAQLSWFDPLFWSVSINGQPATERMLTEFQETDWAFKVNHNDRTIQIKTNV